MRKFKHKDSKIVVIALNDVQADAFLNEGFEEIEPKEKEQKEEK